MESQKFVNPNCTTFINKQSLQFKNGLYLIKLLVKNELLEKDSGYSKAIGCSPETDGKALLLKTTSK